MRLLTLALGSIVATACVPARSATSAHVGNRIVPTPTYTPDDEQLIPRNWGETQVKLGTGVDGLVALNFIQDLQRPKPRIPFVMSMTFLAPREVPLVTIGLYYEKSASNGPTRDLLTGGSFAFQQISDLDSPLTYDASQVKTVQSEKIGSDALGWFQQHRKSIVDSMRSSPEGSALGGSWECDFTTRARPPVDTPAALVVAGGNYAGVEVPYTVIGQRVVFVDR